MAHLNHFGNFQQRCAGLNTESQMADNDYALGLLVEKPQVSSVGRETAIAIEDDSQDGPDHVDSVRLLNEYHLCPTPSGVPCQN